MTPIFCTLKKLFQPKICKCANFVVPLQRLLCAYASAAHTNITKYGI
mgnify:CR=1 FL=1